ncbi:citrate lyase holo-[acyl-carrier protein] synthase [uncultured Desulfuromonas sp.]|uniref:citrate lyase holo-[acyl-carrier protein] synthase n=1 Tax=uncultured Desulfuromonas sp. TaxID=181013 RepID=UPI0026139D46|nr:citrate lyase holo-[acyl-carrier protein] synthase [uncultured Desulfuromonas sp.]
MLFVTFRNKLLEARDSRHRALLRALTVRTPAVLSLALNIPGQGKTPPGSAELFCWGRDRLERSFSGLVEFQGGEDAAGHYALFLLGTAPLLAKVRCLALEESRPAARLLDLDVFDRLGRPIDRALLGLSQRTCLACSRPAKECIRTGSHDQPALQRRIDDLLAPFRPGKAVRRPDRGAA